MEESVMHRDRLSELPESLIHHILSFLPPREVVSTTCLSKHWENLWTTVPCLNFLIDDEIYITEDEDEDKDNKARKTEERFQKLVNRVLLVWKGVKLLKFGIDILFHSSSSLNFDVNVWTRFAVNNKVEELELISNGDDWSPQCLNLYSSLRKLSLSGFDVQIPGSPSWNQLKSLTISVFNHVCISGDLINRILLGSPVLEVFELQMQDNYENLSIRSKSLKELTIENIFHFEEDEPSLDTLTIFCPNLETLTMNGVFGKCLFTDVSSLIDATLSFINYDRGLHCFNELLGESLKQFFSAAIQHVKKVALSDWAVEVIVALQKKYLLPSLPNVKFLELKIKDVLEFSNIMDVLRNFPNILTLVIEHRLYEASNVKIMNYLEFETNVFKSFLLQLKIVEITWSDFSITKKEKGFPILFGIAEFLLKYAIMLEKFVLQFRGITPCQQKKFLEKVMGMPRSSPTVQVILKNN